jgi:Glycine rich protein family
MHQKHIVGMVCAGVACAMVLLAAEPWKNKDSAQWTDDDINKLLTDSPWAKEKTVSPQRQQPYGQRGMGRRGGMGGGYPGGGYPGGGGGYPGGGGGYPGGGGGYPSEQSMNVTIRWDSALPVQQALKRQGAAVADEAKKVADASEKYYVIAVFGFHMPTTRSRYSDDSDQDRDRDSAADRLRNQLLDAAQLQPKGGRSLYAQDVQIEGGGSEIHFLFPRNPGIASSTKEVDFVLQVRDIKVEHKFHFSDMQYQGQLAL